MLILNKCLHKLSLRKISLILSWWMIYLLIFLFLDSRYICHGHILIFGVYFCFLLINKEGQEPYFFYVVIGALSLWGEGRWSSRRARVCRSGIFHVCWITYLIICCFWKKKLKIKILLLYCGEEEINNLEFRHYVPFCIRLFY